MNHPGIDVNLQGGSNNSTALHRAVFSNNLAILAQLLSDDRIDTSLKDYLNRTPLKHAMFHRHYECVKILRDHGAREE